MQCHENITPAHKKIQQPAF